MSINREAAAADFNAIIKAGRKKKEAEKLAQKMLGARRSSTPNNANKKTLTERAGITKRPASLSRSQSSQARLNHTKPEREAPAPRAPRAAQAPRQPRNSEQNTAQSNGGGLSIKGAASGPYVVTASNFAPGTTAADIESVMASVGGEITYCSVVAKQPVVVAEMGFKERSGAEAVISTFHNKKADGRVLYVHFREGASAPQAAPAPQQPQAEIEDEAMEIDENARSREAENKLREERRGGRPREDVFPTGPRNDRQFSGEDDYYRDWQSGPAYQNNRQSFGRGGGGYRQGQPAYFEDRRGGYGRGSGNARY